MKKKEAVNKIIQKKKKKRRGGGAVSPLPIPSDDTVCNYFISFEFVNVISFVYLMDGFRHKDINMMRIYCPYKGMSLLL